MKPTGKALWAILFALVLLFTACHRKGEEEQVTRMEGYFPKMETQILDQHDMFEFSNVDTSAIYFGEIGRQNGFVKLDETGDNFLKGRFFPVDSSEWTSPVAFEILHTDGDYLFRSGTKELTLRFNISYNPLFLAGTFYTSMIKFDQQTITLEKYETPFHTTYNSTRNMLLAEPEMLPFGIRKDIVYGRAKGYWVSNPENEEKFAKIIAKSILKTFKEKELELTMDLYTPEDSMPRHPLIVFIHGGAFYIGDKGAETMAAWCRHFAQLGYVTASINYRMGFKLNKLSIQQCGYSAVQDAHAALRYLTAHAEELAIDTGFIFLAGTSAGAITALATAYWTPDCRPAFIADNDFENLLGGLTTSGNSDSASFRIRALANMWGALYDLKELEGHNIPVISFHGTADYIVPYDEGIPFSSLGDKLFDKMYGSAAIHRELNRLGVNNEFYPLEKAGHAPYQNNKGRPNDCYYYIQSHLQEFFKQQLLETGRIFRVKTQYFTMDQPDIRSIHWKAEGGFILRCEGANVQVVWRKDCPTHRLTASGLRENGAAFTKTIIIKNK